MKCLLLALLAAQYATASPVGKVQSASVKEMSIGAVFGTPIAKRGWWETDRGDGKVGSMQGKLTCNGEPATAVKVKLYDIDNYDPDDLMDEGELSKDGSFLLHGSQKEGTKIDPKLNIYHSCNHNGICTKKVAIIIPKDYVSEGEVAEKVFDIGEINLAGRFSGESIDCIN